MHDNQDGGRHVIFDLCARDAECPLGKTLEPPQPDCPGRRVTTDPNHDRVPPGRHYSERLSIVFRRRNVMRGRRTKLLAIQKMITLKNTNIPTNAIAAMPAVKMYVSR